GVRARLLGRYLCGELYLVALQCREQRRINIPAIGCQILAGDLEQVLAFGDPLALLDIDSRDDAWLWREHLRGACGRREVPGDGFLSRIRRQTKKRDDTGECRDIEPGQQFRRKWLQQHCLAPLALVALEFCCFLAKQRWLSHLHHGG